MRKEKERERRKKRKKKKKKRRRKGKKEEKKKRKKEKKRGRRKKKEEEEKKRGRKKILPLKEQKLRPLANTKVPHNVRYRRAKRAAPGGIAKSPVAQIGGLSHPSQGPPRGGRL